MHYKYHAVDSAGKVRDGLIEADGEPSAKSAIKEQRSLPRFFERDGERRWEQNKPKNTFFLRDKAEAAHTTGPAARIPAQGRGAALSGPHDHREPARRGERKTDSELPLRRGEGRLIPLGRAQGLPRAYSTTFSSIRFQQAKRPAPSIRFSSTRPTFSKAGPT